MKLHVTESTTLEALLALKMKDISKSKIKRWLKYELILVNGTPVKRLDVVVAPHDELEIRFESA